MRLKTKVLPTKKKHSPHRLWQSSAELLVFLDAVWRHAGAGDEIKQVLLLCQQQGQGGEIG